MNYYEPFLIIVIPALVGYACWRYLNHKPLETKEDTKDSKLKRCGTCKYFDGSYDCTHEKAKRERINHIEGVKIRYYCDCNSMRTWERNCGESARYYEEK